MLLDSGAVYRAVAIAALQAGVDADDEPALEALALAMDLRFAAGRTFLAGADVSDSLRLEAVGALASRISAWPRVRHAVLGVQTAFRRLPGLVADGRDMGTVVFPDATLKVFLTASAAERAERRYKQLISKGISANIDSLRADLEARDARDIQSQRIAPEASRRRVPSGQLGADDRSFGRRRARSLGGTPAFRPTAGLKTVIPGAAASPPRASWHTEATDPST